MWFSTWSPAPTASAEIKRLRNKQLQTYSFRSSFHVLIVFKLYIVSEPNEDTMIQLHPWRDWDAQARFFFFLLGLLSDPASGVSAGSARAFFFLETFLDLGFLGSFWSLFFRDFLGWLLALGLPDEFREGLFGLLSFCHCLRTCKRGKHM